MPHSQSFDTIILRTIDIGEADRFAILFTKQGGRKTAKAKGVRKANSRLGGLILPFKHLSMELTESSAGNIITSATDRMSDAPPITSASFLMLQQGIEFLLALTEDDEPLPRVFELLLQFIKMCPASDKDLLPAFQLRLLHLLGLLPARLEDLRFAKLPATDSAFIEACTQISDLHLLRDLYPESDYLKAFLQAVTHDHISRPLKSADVRL